MALPSVPPQLPAFALLALPPPHSADSAHQGLQRCLDCALLVSWRCLRFLHNCQHSHCLPCLHHTPLTPRTRACSAALTAHSWSHGAAFGSSTTASIRTAC